MDPKHIDILRKLQPSIVKDLEIRDIIDTLISKGVVTHSLWDEIVQERSFESQNRKLLNILPRRGPEAYFTFKESMRNNYQWITEEMDTLENTEDCVDSLDTSLGSNTPHSHFPANPPLSVKRAQKMRKLRQGLNELKPGNYLVLHALEGYGKSTLASSTLRDKDLVARLFKNEIYWIKFGQRQSISETILIQLNVLFHLVRNLDSWAEPTSENALKYSLRRHFTEHDQALIILDNVNSFDVIEAFDFGCKTLVLTTDVDILRGRRNNVIEMSDGFSANESLDLFATAIGIPVCELPKQARQIHDECNGMPLMISIFSAHFASVKETLINSEVSDENWSHYLNTFRERASDVLKESLERQAATFDLGIEKLSDEDQRYYKSLAIFPEDVNISTKTLSIYWGQALAEVDSRMLKFCKKSLACREWHGCYNTYVYGVHNLVLSHLRQNLEPSYLEELHKTYVLKNLAPCLNSDYSKLAQDNYVLSYIGYHMEKGNLIPKFSELYLNFGFIESKVFHIGPGDLLIDLKKYKNYITSNLPSLSQDVEDLEMFLIQQASTLAEYRRRNCLDLVQVALKHSIDGFIRRTGERLASEQKENLYFNHLKHSIADLDYCSEELHLQVKCVAFLNEANEILVGNGEGKVILWNCGNRQHIVFRGNNRDELINKIVAPQNGNFFISISGDGKAKLFDIRRDFFYNKNDDQHNKTLHPRAKQPRWINISEAEYDQDDSKITLHINGQKILDIAVSEEGKKIAACTDSGFIAIWDYEGRFLVEPQEAAKNGLSSIAFSKCGMLLHAVNSATGGLLVLDSSNGQYKSQFSVQPERDRIISLISVPQYYNLLVLLLETKLYRVSWALDSDFGQGLQCEKFAQLGDRTSAYSCASVTKDGKYIVMADTGGSVNVCELHGELKIVKTYKNLVSSLDTHWLKDEASHIICAGNRDTLVPMVHKWKFDPKEKPVVRRLALFDATMEPDGKNIVAVATSNGTVQIIKNDDVIAETPCIDEKITSLLIFNGGNNVVYATENGGVFIFDVKLNHCREIMELSESVKFMNILNIDGSDTIICGQGEENLQIWKSPDDTQLVENSGLVIFCDSIKSVKRILTVAETVLKIWDEKTWKLQSSHVVRTVPKISCASLSQKQNYLSLSNANGNLNIMKLIPKGNIRNIKFQDFMEHKFNDEITAASFTSDEQLLALGFKTGDIRIISTQSESVIRKFKFHRREVRELHWGPACLDEPILLSLANELAWWSIPIKIKKETAAQREISHSLSELTISPEFKNPARLPLGTMRTSRSLELANGKQMDNLKSPDDFKNNAAFFTDEYLGSASVSSNSNSNSSSKISLAQSLNALNGKKGDENNRIVEFWDEKKPKYPKVDGLLSVIKLDGNLAKKVCISKDFSHFLTLNGEGTICNLRILDGCPSKESRFNSNDDT